MKTLFYQSSILLLSVHPAGCYGENPLIQVIKTSMKDNNLNDGYDQKTHISYTLTKKETFSIKSIHCL